MCFPIFFLCSFLYPLPALMAPLIPFLFLFFKSKAMFSVFCFPHVPLLTSAITLLVWKPSATLLAEVLVFSTLCLSSLIPRSPFSNQPSYQLPTAVTLLHCLHYCFWHFLWTILSYYFSNGLLDYSTYIFFQSASGTFPLFPSSFSAFAMLFVLLFIFWNHILLSRTT